MLALILLLLASQAGPVAAPSAAAEPGWAWPLRGPVITPYRNGADPYAGGQHRGIDIAGRVGDPVVAAAAGSVRFAGLAGSSGLTVDVRTADGRYDTSYLHLSKIEVRKGAVVHAGKRIGRVGTTGRRSAGAPHLHFGVRDSGSRHGYHDPLHFLPPPLAPEPGRPPGAPAPVGAPVRPAPAPAPARPSPGLERRRLPAPARLPRAAPRPAPAPAPRSALRPHAGPAPARLGVEEPEPARLPSLSERAAAHLPLPTGRPAAGTAPAQDPGASPNALSHGPRHSAPTSRRGPDLGLALACVGLLLAAALVGGTEEGRAAAGRGRARLAALLHPLAGRG